MVIPCSLQVGVPLPETSEVDGGKYIHQYTLKSGEPTNISSDLSTQGKKVRDKMCDRQQKKELKIC